MSTLSAKVVTAQFSDFLRKNIGFNGTAASVNSTKTQSAANWDYLRCRSGGETALLWPTFVANAHGISKTNARKNIGSATKRDHRRYTGLLAAIPAIDHSQLFGAI